MSYQVLARKWRPQTFADVVGQEHVLTALANGLSLGRIHHAYLFSGTRGVGKTSIARLLAKGLNCETGITATPCGVCDNCREIEQGRFVDLIEIDAASRTKVEDTRDLLDNVQYAPDRGRFKVYLIDEVHMLSRHSFNALLKTLEEPPAHVKFLLATTDPQKLPVTILSRCLQFHLKALDVEQIRHQLEHILGEEQIAFEPRALQLLSRAADGSLRDALSLTDQAIASGEGQLTAASVSTMLGTLDDDQALSLIEALVAADHAGEDVIDDHRQDGGEQADGRRQQRFCDARRYHRKIGGLGLGDADKAVHDAPDGTKQTHKRGNGADGRQVAVTATHMATDRCNAALKAKTGSFLDAFIVFGTGREFGKHRNAAPGNRRLQQQ